MKAGEFNILCNVCGEPISKEQKELGFSCSKACDAEQRLVPTAVDEIRFQVKLFQPIKFIEMKFEVDGSAVKDPETFRQLLSDLVVEDRSDE